jgi:hypothetical protein
MRHNKPLHPIAWISRRRLNGGVMRKLIGLLFVLLALPASAEDVCPKD